MLIHPGGVEVARRVDLGGGVLLHAGHHRHRLRVLYRRVPRHRHRRHVARATEAQGAAHQNEKNMFLIFLFSRDASLPPHSVFSSSLSGCPWSLRLLSSKQKETSQRIVLAQVSMETIKV